MPPEQAPLPEVQLAQTLERLDRLGRRKAALQRQMDEVLEQIRETVLEADAQGGTMRRIVELARINNRQFYLWRPAVNASMSRKKKT